MLFYLIILTLMIYFNGTINENVILFNRFTFND